MTTSLPPEITRPSGNSAEGGRYATALENSEECDTILLSWILGFSFEMSHTIVLPSRETEMTALGFGNVTPRTYGCLH